MEIKSTNGFNGSLSQQRPSNSSGSNSAGLNSFGTDPIGGPLNIQSTVGLNPLQVVREIARQALPTGANGLDAAQIQDGFTAVRSHSDLPLIVTNILKESAGQLSFQAGNAKASHTAGTLAVLGGLESQDPATLSTASLPQGASLLRLLQGPSPQASLQSGAAALKQVAQAVGCQVAVELCASPLPPSAIVDLLAGMTAKGDLSLQSYGNLAQSQLDSSRPLAQRAQQGMDELIQASELAVRSKMMSGQNTLKDLSLNRLLRASLQGPQSQFDKTSVQMGLLTATAGLQHGFETAVTNLEQLLNSTSTEVDTQLACRSGVNFLQNLAANNAVDCPKLAELKDKIEQPPSPLGDAQLVEHLNQVLTKANFSDKPEEHEGLLRCLERLGKRMEQGPGLQPKMAGLLTEARGKVETMDTHEKPGSYLKGLVLTLQGLEGQDPVKERLQVHLPSIGDLSGSAEISSKWDWPPRQWL